MHSVVKAETAEITELNLIKRLSQLEAVFEYCPVGISIVDKKGFIVSSNPAMQKLFNLSAQDYVGKNVKEMVEKDIFSPEVSTKVLETGCLHTILQKIKGGRMCLTIGSPVIGDNNQVELVVVTTNDVTELYALKESLSRTQKLAGSYQAELIDMRMAQMQEENIVVRSKKMLDLIDLAKRLASVDTTVLILGESGVGKEVVATLLHRASLHRSEKPFVKVNCGAIPRDLLESELFGYEHGAFTGAAKDGRIGLFELADGGSIFLDEISELSLDLQVKLLRVLQEKEFTRIGGTKVVKVDVRVIAASNRNILELVREGKFRQDLYYRLNVVPLGVPPLRERTEDIVALAQHYVRYFNQKYSLEKVLSAELIDIMERYTWPGNVRELVNVIERMVVTSVGNILGVEDFPIELRFSGLHISPEERRLIRSDNIQENIEEVEKYIILNALKDGLTLNTAARKLGISRATLARKIKKYGIRNLETID